MSNGAARFMVGAAFGLIPLLLLNSSTQPAFAFDHGFDPLLPTSKWMHALKRPDDPMGSCCGKGDAYGADTYQRNPDGSYDVAITDGAAIEFPDGTKRAPIENGTKLHVPAGKINPPKEQAGNPTGHAWVFLSIRVVSTSASEDGVLVKYAPDTIWCFVPLPEGS